MPQWKKTGWIGRGLWKVEGEPPLLGIFWSPPFPPLWWSHRRGRLPLTHCLFNSLSRCGLEFAEGRPECWKFTKKRKRNWGSCEAWEPLGFLQSWHTHTHSAPLPPPSLCGTPPSISPAELSQRLVILKKSLPSYWCWVNPMFLFIVGNISIRLQQE